MCKMPAYVRTVKCSHSFVLLEKLDYIVLIACSLSEVRITTVNIF